MRIKQFTLFRNNYYESAKRQIRQIEEFCYGVAEIKSEICRINEHFEITRKLECYGSYNSESCFVGNGQSEYSWNW